MVAVIHTTLGEHTLFNHTSHCGQGWAQGPLMACAQTEGLGLVSPVSRTVPGCQLSANAPGAGPPRTLFLSLPGIETRQPGREGAFCLHLGHGCRHEWRDFRCVNSSDLHLTDCANVYLGHV